MSFLVYQAQGLRIFAGDTATCAGYTGNAGEISVNTETKAVYVHDGLTAGGTPLTTAEQAELLGMTLGQLANVELDSPSDGQVLVYDEAAEVWKNELVAGAGGGAVDLDGLNDVELANPADNQVLTYNQGLSKWENKEAPQADISNLYTKSEVDSFVQSKADQTHAHDQYYEQNSQLEIGASDSILKIHRADRPVRFGGWSIVGYAGNFGGDYTHVKLNINIASGTMATFRIWGYKPYGQILDMIIGGYTYNHSSYQNSVYGVGIKHNDTLGSLIGQGAMYYSNDSNKNLCISFPWGSGYSKAQIERMGYSSYAGNAANVYIVAETVSNSRTGAF